MPFSCFCTHYSGNHDVEVDVSDPFDIAGVVKRRDEIDGQISKVHDEGTALHLEITNKGNEMSMKRENLDMDIEATKKKLEELQV